MSPSISWNKFIVPTTAGLMLSAALVGCSSQNLAQRQGVLGSQAMPVAAQPFEHPLADLPGESFSMLPRIDLTRENVASQIVVEATIFDSRTVVPQISEFVMDPPQTIKPYLPAHHRDKTLQAGVPNDLPLGNLIDEPRVAPDASFPGLTNTGWNPPDPSLAVGPNHVVSVVNSDIAWYTKTGTRQFLNRLGVQGNPGFFEPVGAGNFTFDPKCMYDQKTGRFIVVALEVYTSTAFIDIAVSDDSDPNGVWYKYRTPAVVSIGSTTYWVDYPGIGYDDNAFYVSGNLFKLQGNGGGWGGVIYRIFDKTPMLTGAPVTISDLRDANSASVQVGQVFGPSSLPFFVSLQSSSALRVQSITNPLTAPAFATTTVTVPTGTNPVDAPNNGGFISTVDRRIMNVHWRNGNLYATHTTLAAGKNQARWYHMDTGNWPTSGGVTLVQSGNIDGGAGVHTFFPAIASNAANSVALVAAGSSSSQFASVNATGRGANEPAGTMGALTQLIIGTQSASGRWGDYFDIAVDPNDDSTFWMVGEYQVSGGWRTTINSFVVTPPTPDVTFEWTASSTTVSPNQSVTLTLSANRATGEWYGGGKFNVRVDGLDAADLFDTGGGLIGPEIAGDFTVGRAQAYRNFPTDGALIYNLNSNIIEGSGDGGSIDHAVIPPLLGGSPPLINPTPVWSMTFTPGATLGDRVFSSQFTDATLGQGGIPISTLFADGSITISVVANNCPVDLNGDGNVDVLDFFVFISLFNTGDAQADLNNDGIVDVLDFFAFISLFNIGC